MGSPESRYPPAWVGVGDSVGGDAMRHGVNGVATLVAWNAGGPAFAQISRCMDSPPGWGGVKRSRRTAPSGATHSQMPQGPTLE